MPPGSSSRYSPAGIFLVLVMLIFGWGCNPSSEIGAERVLPRRIMEIQPPEDFTRVTVSEGSFAWYLRQMGLLNGETVYLYNGREKRNQSAHFRIVDLSVGNRDLQQCADALLRIRTEYYYSSGQKPRIRFHFTSGHVSDYSRWAAGFRPVISGNSVRFQQTGRRGDDRRNLDEYLQNLFTYAGTISLKRDSRPVQGAARIGDFFLQSGSPGHAVMILDHVQDPAGRSLYLLGQSYMPAQQFHVLRNLYMPGEVVPGFENYGNVWYELDPSGDLKTPEWTFPSGSLRRWN